MKKIEEVMEEARGMVCGPPDLLDWIEYYHPDHSKLAAIIDVGRRCEADGIEEPSMDDIYNKINEIWFGLYPEDEANKDVA